MNPHAIRYVFSVTYKDYSLVKLKTSTSNESGQDQYSFSETLCTIAVLTDHLATRLHTSIIGQLMSLVRQSRQSKPIDPLEVFKKVRPYLDGIYNSKMLPPILNYTDCFGKPAVYKLDIDLFEFQESLESSLLLQAIKIVFRRMSAARILYILSAILQEKTVILHSRSRQLCCQSM